MIDLLQRFLLIPTLLVVLVYHCLHPSEPLRLPLMDLARQLFATTTTVLGWGASPGATRFRVLFVKQSCSELAVLKLWMELHHVELGEQTDEILGVRQEKPLDVVNTLLLFQYLVLLRYLRADHLIDILEHRVNSRPLLLFLLDISDCLKSDTL